MKKDKLMEQKIRIAEKRIQELIKSRDIKKLDEKTKEHITKFYENMSINRLETAKIIYKISTDL